MAKTFRLYTRDELVLDKIIILTEEQTHYLKNVVKYGEADKLCCFDGRNGEFLCEVLEIKKKNMSVRVVKKIKEFAQCPDIWLLFAPLKKDNTDFVIEKATELGCRRIVPVITQYTNTTNVKIERYTAQSIEAAEQCRRTDVPEISAVQRFEDVLKDWDGSRKLFFMDETLESQSFFEVLREKDTEKAAIFVGPEGGFSEDELLKLRGLPYAVGATLGTRILRAETAVVASLSCWQMIAGDWSK